MHSKISRSIVISVLLAVFMATAGLADEPEYKEYSARTTRAKYLEIAFTRNTVELTGVDTNREATLRFDRSDVEIKGDVISVGASPVFTPEGIVIDNIVYGWNRLDDMRIHMRGRYTVITLYERTGAADNVSRMRRGNIFSYADGITVDEEEFVRGFVFSIIGDITVDGEVNKDVVSLFGDISFGPDAVIRGDVATISGRTDQSRRTSIYGEVFDGKRRTGRRGRFYRNYEIHAVEAGLGYNRVDGAMPWLEYRFDYGDSILPRLAVRGGYAFNSERWRYQVDLEQTVWRSRPLVIGGEVYRRLASGDDWLISGSENTFFALTVTEDFKDYYEAEGASAYLKFLPLGEDFTFESRYRYEETRWFDARAHLWSLFGGDKLFSQNFARVDPLYREAAIAEIDTTSNASLSFMIDYDTRDEESAFDKSAWAATGEFEWSSPDINSDFDYRKYTVSLRRYQRINRRAMLMLRGMYGGSDGYLPMYKRFYMGGLGTLRGYYHKEYMGTRFWMGNAEYRFSFPHSSLALSVIYDVAQIANERKLDGDVDVKQSLGLALYVSEDAHISLARRLDRSSGNDPKFYARLTHVF